MELAENGQFLGVGRDRVGPTPVEHRPEKPVLSMSLSVIVSSDNRTRRTHDPRVVDATTTDDGTGRRCEADHR
jgi:hypothetical protein